MTKKNKAPEKTINLLNLPEDIEALRALAQEQHAKIANLTEQRDNLSKRAKELGEDLDTLRESTEIQRAKDMRIARIRQEWWSTHEKFKQEITKLLLALPLPTDTAFFEAGEWDMLAETQALARRLLSELETLRLHQFVEAVVDEQSEPVEVLES